MTLESGFTVTELSWTNNNFLLRRGTNDIASFCIDNRLRQMPFFVFPKVGKGRLSRYVERFWNKISFVCSSFFRYYIKQILTKFLSSRYNFLKTCFGVAHAIISSMCCSVFHCFIYVYSLSTLTIWNLKYSNSYNSARANTRAQIP